MLHPALTAPPPLNITIYKGMPKLPTLVATPVDQGAAVPPPPGTPPMSWTSSNPSLLGLTPSTDGLTCTMQLLGNVTGTVIVTVTMPSLSLTSTGTVQTLQVPTQIVLGFLP